MYTFCFSFCFLIRIPCTDDILYQRNIRFDLQPGIAVVRHVIDKIIVTVVFLFFFCCSMIIINCVGLCHTNHFLVKQFCQEFIQIHMLSLFSWVSRVIIRMKNDSSEHPRFLFIHLWNKIRKTQILTNVFRHFSRLHSLIYIL